MKSRYIPLHYVLMAFAVSLIGVTALSVPVTHAAEQTTWQKFVEKKCGDMSADNAERCARNLTNELKGKCGAPKENDTYTNCWRKFIRDNGGTAGPDSSPFEEEQAPDTDRNTQGCGGVSTNIITCGEKGGNPVLDLLLQIVNFLAVGVGIAVVGGIIWGGMIYASSNGDSNKIQQAKMIIVNAVVGLLLFFFMYAVLNYLIPGGLFN